MSKLRDIPYWALNLVLFKCTWLLLVLGQNSVLPYAILLQGLSLWLHPTRVGNLPQVVLVAMLGMLIDYLLSLMEVFAFPGSTFPAWLALLWLAFALALGEGFVFLQKLRVPLIGVIGLLLGPLGYWLGFRMGAVDFPLPVASTLLLLSVLWGLLLPGAVLALRKIPSPEADTTTAALQQPARAQTNYQD